MKAVKGNKVYTIDELQRKFYEDSGFDILNDQGDVIAYGRGKTVPYGEYETLKKEKERLEKENAGLKEQLERRPEAETGKASEKPPGKAGKQTGAGE